MSPIVCQWAAEFGTPEMVKYLYSKGYPKTKKELLKLINVTKNPKTIEWIKNVDTIIIKKIIN